MSNDNQNNQENQSPEEIKKDETLELVCRNVWCKARFFIKESVISNYSSGVCDKCKDLDQNMSGGVSWEDHKYDGSRFDGRAHPIHIKVNNYK